MKSARSYFGTRGRSFALAAAAVAAGTLATTALPSLAENQPAPPSTGASVPATYFGPAPSQSFSPGNQYLVGPQQLLKSGTIDHEANTITLPLYLGHSRNGDNVWYILTDTTDERNADALGLNFSAKLGYTAVGNAYRKATLEKDASLTFEKGKVNFAQERTLVPGDAPNFFPPKVATAGSVGDKDYTPYVQVQNIAGSPIYNAPVIAYGSSAAQLNFCDGNVDHKVAHDRVVKICPTADSNGQGTVTLQTTSIFSFAKPATYISTESSDQTVATLDNGTFAPALGDLAVGRDDSAFSPIERLFVTANGPTGKQNPQRQGLNSALAGEGPPLNVIGGIPNVANDYSPAWDINLGEWTKTAVDSGYRSRLIDEFQILGLVRDGWITGPGGKPYGSVGIVVNCPIIERLL